MSNYINQVPCGESTSCQKELKTFVFTGQSWGPMWHSVTVCTA